MAEKTKEKETKAVTPWRPLMDLTRWERDMERVMEDFFGDLVAVPYPVLLKEHRLGLTTVRVEADYQAPVRYGDDLRVCMSVEKVGRSSVTFLFEAYRPDQVLAARSKLIKAYREKILTAQTAVFGAPPIDGLGSTGGFKLYVQDRTSIGPRFLEGSVGSLASAGSAQPGER